MNETLYEGLGIGGPMDGREIESRYPSGVIFVSKPTNRAWIYDFYADQGKFYARPVGYDALWDEMNVEQKLNVTRATVLTGMDPTRELDLEEIRDYAGKAELEIRALPEESREVV